MDKDKILTMEAGEEIDALVAERVMKWRPDRRHNRWTNNEGEFQRYIYYDSDSCSEPFAPSEELESAWDVMNKIKYEVFGIFWENRPGIKDWCVVLKPEDSYSGGIPVYADELPLAICRAALLAMEGK